jgi:glyoxylase-like metal-dependent hydrolase (beta-lactamase superfamily II)
MQVVADGVHRLGSSLINWYLVEDGGRYTVVDAGLPGYRSQLDDALSQLGGGLDDIEAVILTHGHSDHVGFAGKLHEEAGMPVHVHEADAEMTRTGKIPGGERGVRPYLLNPPLYKLLLHGALNGGARTPTVSDVSTFGAGDVLDVPGRPRAIHAPGHTRGCCAFHFEERGLLLAGDVLCTRNPMTARKGPQIMPGSFTIDIQQALDSLAAIEAVDAGTVAVGHGDPWTKGTASAVAAAREAGPS